MPHLEVRVLGVGNGDAILLTTPSRKTILIDTGPDASILRALGQALPEWQRHLDAVILTSSVADATGGLPEVEKKYTVGAILQAPQLREGTRLSLGGGIFIEVLWPSLAAENMKPADSALAVRISGGTKSYLIEENLSTRVQKWLDVRADVTISTSTPAGEY